MTWTAPATIVAGQIMTAAIWNAQVRDNMLVLAQVPAVNSFTSSGTYTKPADLKWAVVKMWGGGASGSAAGGGGNSGPAMGAGGGGGGYTENLYAASGLSSTEALVVGVGGSGTAGAGNPGTASTFKSLTANGGTNGAAMAFAPAAGAMAAPGTGGTATGGDVNLTGEDGGRGQVVPTTAVTAVFINDGGGSPNGGARVTLGASSPTVGVAGKFPGGGATGSYATPSTGMNGANGAAGRVLVYSYFS